MAKWFYLCEYCGEHFIYHIKLRFSYVICDKCYREKWRLDA